MSEEVYLELETADGGEKHRIDLAPVNMIEETMIKEIIVDTIDVDVGDSEDPTTYVTDYKMIVRTFTLTGTITVTPDDGGMSLLAKKTRLRKLFGITVTIPLTRLKFHYEDNDYNGYMTRLSFVQACGESSFEYTIELTEGLQEE